MRFQLAALLGAALLTAPTCPLTAQSEAVTRQIMRSNAVTAVPHAWTVLESMRFIATDSVLGKNHP